jgi:hypothetical protein
MASSDAGADFTDDESEIDDTQDLDDHLKRLSYGGRRLSKPKDEFDVLKNLLARRKKADEEEKGEDQLESEVSYAPFTSSDAISITSAWREPEIEQLRKSIKDILAHLYKLATFIRKSVPQDRLRRAAKINVDHFETFDAAYVRDCFPAAPEWLQDRLAKAITRRRQRLIYDRKHHRKLSKPQISSKPPLQRASTDEGFGTGTIIARTTLAPTVTKFQTSLTHISPHAPPLSTVFGTSVASGFVPQALDNGNIPGDQEVLSEYTGRESSIAGPREVVHIPARPRGTDGEKLDEFECPYCFCLQDIHHDRVWK